MRTTLLTALALTGLRHDDWGTTLAALAALVGYQAFCLTRDWQALARIEREAEFLQGYVDSE